jgi:hypothetical protein
MLAGLSQAVAEPAGKPLFASRKAAGLFPATAVARDAARRCLEAGYLSVVRREQRGKTAAEICAITEEGVAFLLARSSPRAVLDEFVRAVEARGRQVEDLIAAARGCQATLDELLRQAKRVMGQLNSPVTGSGDVRTNGVLTHPSAGAWETAALEFLARWRSTRPSDDCPLPELFRAARQATSALTVGQFHDGLRKLHGAGQVLLHPWTGPLPEMPEPQHALLIGHTIAYYASVR